MKELDFTRFRLDNDYYDPTAGVEISHVTENGDFCKHPGEVHNLQEAVVWAQKHLEENHE